MDLIDEWIDFLNAAPTAWHAVEYIQNTLQKAGFELLDESTKWRLKPGGKYLVQRNGSTLAAFVLPTHAPVKAHVVGSHTDSPGFKLKPQPEFLKENMLMLGLEIYGGPLLSSWLNRDLGIAGRVVVEDKKGNLHEKLVRIEDHPVVIPQLAIHLDRNVNDSGLVLNKQEHLAALAALDIKPDKKTGTTHYLEGLLKKQFSFATCLGHELFVYPLEPAKRVGHDKEMLASYRVDNLGSAHAAFKGLLEGAKKPHKDLLRMAVFWDNEEIGSNTSQGAGSPFLPYTLERICLSLKLDREDLFRLVSQSLCLSVDFGHALHPNYPEKHEPRHLLLMNKGIAIKTNAQQRYASDAKSVSEIVSLCRKHKIPYQKFVARNDIPSGTTIGPIHANLTGMPTLDIGCAQLSMHSARELASCADHLSLCKLLGEFF